MDLLRAVHVAMHEMRRTWLQFCLSFQFPCANAVADSEPQKI
jgi:hypothetical protein